jgi:hypothetical protein
LEKVGEQIYRPRGVPNLAYPQCEKEYPKDDEPNALRDGKENKADNEADSGNEGRVDHKFAEAGRASDVESIGGEEYDDTCGIEGGQASRGE